MMQTASIQPEELQRLQGRTVRILAAGQVLGAIAFGITVSVGALLAAVIAENDALSGLATATVTLGAAFAAMPLAALANRRGRRWSLGLGNALALVGIAVVLLAAGATNFITLLLGFALIGVGNAGNLQARFAATDLALPERRARDLSFVVWATTIGAVLGPNLQGPGESIGSVLHLPPMTGAYVFAVVAQVAALLVFTVGLRPDPLLAARRISAQHTTIGAEIADDHDRPWLARYAILAVAASHGVMVSVMSMTPIHLKHHGETLVVIGFTISMHIAGMYALAPVFGVLADRFGRIPLILIGQVQLVASLLLAFVLSESQTAIVISLVLLGTGWSASTVAGSALLSEASALRLRTRRQGRSDAIMSFTGAASAIIAGGIVATIGYPGLALAALAFVAAVVIAMPFAARYFASSGGAS